MWQHKKLPRTMTTAVSARGYKIIAVRQKPIPLLLRFFGGIPLAAISFLLGALVSRFGWIAVGKISGRDPESVFASQR